ncbi:MAG: hypothetical protein WCO57_13035, partial [Verrucomicrobiota bacterium]
MNPPSPAADAVSSHGQSGMRLAAWTGTALAVLVLLWFFAWVPRFGPGRGYSALGWIHSAWNGENDYEHGLVFPFLITDLIIYRFKD